MALPDRSQPFAVHLAQSPEGKKSTSLDTEDVNEPEIVNVSISFPRQLLKLISSLVNREVSNDGAELVATLTIWTKR